MVGAEAEEVRWRAMDPEQGQKLSTCKSSEPSKGLFHVLEALVPDHPAHIEQINLSLSIRIS